MLLCGTISAYACRLGSWSNGTRTNTPARSLMVKVGTTSPRATRVPSTPSSSRASRVRACTTNARDVFAPRVS